MRLPFFFLLAMSCAAVADALSSFGNGEGVNGGVLAMAVQTDGKVVIGGSFSAVNGVPRQNLARLNADGTLDESFLPQAAEGPNGPVNALLILPDGAILVGGDFTAAGNLVRSDLVKFHPDGTADPAFGGMEGGIATNGSVAALALQPDGSVVVGGNFTAFYGQLRRGIARLDPKGAVAAAGRESETLNGSVAALAAVPGGAVVAGGRFSAPFQPARSILLLGR